jgi:DNA-binding response OmpR family regulator
MEAFAMTLTTFPAADVDTEADVQAPARAPAVDVSGRRSTRARVLIVTDDPAALRDATVAMTTAGMLCLPVESDAGAMRRAAQWEPDVALVLANVVPLDRRVQWLNNEGSALVVMVFGEGERLGGEEERLALEVGFDAVWSGLGAPTLLCSRLQALLRPRQRNAVRRVETGIMLGDLAIDGDLPLARRRGRVVPLTGRQVPDGRRAGAYAEPRLPGGDARERR